MPCLFARIVALLAAMAVSSASAQIAPDPGYVPQNGARKQRFSGYLHTASGGETIRFAMYEPREKTGGTVPLVVALHNTKGGSSNGSQIGHESLAFEFTGVPEQGANPAFVVAPLATGDWQQPAASGEATMGDTPSDSLAAVFALVEELVRTRPIDPARVYIVGPETGGSAALEAAARRPDLFAAVVALTPSLHKDTASRLLKTPILVLARTASDTQTADVVQRLRDAGHSTVQFVSTVNDRDGLKDAGMAAWLFQQRRNAR